MRYILLLSVFLVSCSYSDFFQKPKDYYYKILPQVRSQIREEAKTMIGASKNDVVNNYGPQPQGGLFEKDTKMRDFKTSTLYDCRELWTYRLKRKTTQRQSDVFFASFCFDDHAVIAVNVD